MPVIKERNTEYISRVNKAIDYIELHLEKPMTLEELASVANFSKFHFNRIFSAAVGETPFRFILRLRLEKAAALMKTNKHENISEIALKCGFSDISIFSRNFKNHFHISPSEFRKENSNISQLQSNSLQDDTMPQIYFCPELQTIKWRTNMEINKGVEVKELQKMTVAYIRNMGAYDGNQELFQELRNKLFTWAGANGLLGGDDFYFMVLYHDDPNVALGDNLRMSLCITVPEETKVEGEIGKMELEQAKYAVARFELTGSDFQTAWDWVYGQWLPNSGYQPDDKPCFEKYLHPPVDGNYTIDICVPVKAI